MIGRHCLGTAAALQLRSVVVRAVDPAGPAAQAGVKPGDELVRFTCATCSEMCPLRDSGGYRERIARLERPLELTFRRPGAAAAACAAPSPSAAPPVATRAAPSPSAAPPAAVSGWVIRPRRSKLRSVFICGALNRWCTVESGVWREWRAEPTIAVTQAPSQLAVENSLGLTCYSELPLRVVPLSGFALWEQEDMGYSGNSSSELHLRHARHKTIVLLLLNSADANMWRKALPAHYHYADSNQLKLANIASTTVHRSVSSGIARGHCTLCRQTTLHVLTARGAGCAAQGAGSYRCVGCNKRTVPCCDAACINMLPPPVAARVPCAQQATCKGGVHLFTGGANTAAGEDATAAVTSAAGDATAPPNVPSEPAASGAVPPPSTGATPVTCALSAPLGRSALLALVRDRVASFAEVRQGSRCSFIVDGEDVFSAMVQLLEHAKHRIMMSFWIFSATVLHPSARRLLRFSCGCAHGRLACPAPLITIPLPLQSLSCALPRLLTLPLAALPPTYASPAHANHAYSPARPKHGTAELTAVRSRHPQEHKRY